MSEQLLEIAERAVKMAENLGADQAEAYIGKSRSFVIDVENSAIKGAEEQRDAGIGIRTIINKKIGFAYVTTIYEDDVKEAVSRSFELAKASIPDPKFVSLPSAESTYPEVKGLFDKKINELSSDTAAEYLIRVIDSSKQGLEGREFAINGGIQTSSSMNAVVNSQGIAKTSQRTSMTLYSSPIVKEGDDQTTSYEYQISRNLSDIDPEWIGENAARLTLNSLGPKTIEGGEMQVMFAPLGASAILGRGFAGAVSAEEVQKGRSYISDAFGDKISSEIVNITDDSLLPSGIGSRPFDGEGYPTQSTSIINSGVLKSLLHNSYTANKDDVANTGNASRPSYSGLPSISTSNFVLSPGKGTLDDLVSEIDKGVLCNRTGDRPNMTTGDLSAMLLEGFYIEHGEIQHPLKNTLVGINMRDLLQRIIRIGEDTRITFSMVTPSFVIDNATVTSG
ncbi:MAG: TldD/PmbA family protein [Candidatus Thorarchaeota archaeon]|jgi:PmbA protein